jgi:hypothetical protein
LIHWICIVMNYSWFCWQVSSGSAHFLDDTEGEVTPAAPLQDTSSCSEGREDTIPFSPGPVSGASRKLLLFCNDGMLWAESQNVWVLHCQHTEQCLRVGHRKGSDIDKHVGKCMCSITILAHSPPPPRTPFYYLIISKTIRRAEKVRGA